MAVALAAATVGVAGMTAGIALGSVTFGLIMALAVLVSLERPHPFWAYVAFVSFYELSICATGLATAGAVVRPHHLGVVLVANCLLLLAMTEAISFVRLRAAGRSSGELFRNGQQLFGRPPAALRSLRPRRLTGLPSSISSRPGKVD